jgi:acyl-CoA hydrolase
LEVEVKVYSEGALTGTRQMTSRAYLTFVTLDRDGKRVEIPPLAIGTDDERKLQEAAGVRREEHLARRSRAMDI